ncbi:hypothetical protein [Allonocardiopsis opalescens]|uniref:Uncharacterized protein n=1 Tax=Allonocardiopsis opalescens TaxID=1144618 RepID=A0A2T0Q0R2_9ACTN|nr:hypothetical protein [Allonocardiopsis opalescens]PRX97379.1 hypothetical protein CLV72_106417 [Allonocardiopsis opalescens]
MAEGSGSGDAGRNTGGAHADGKEADKRLAIELIAAYTSRDPGAVRAVVGRIEPTASPGVGSELKILASFLTLRAREAGVVWGPEDARTAVGSTIAGILEPEHEFAVVASMAAFADGDVEEATKLTNGDDTILLHMLAAYAAGLGGEVYRPAELLATLRIATGIVDEPPDADRE